MATNFSANQYENSFAAKRLQNWQIPKNFKEHPSSKTGSTKPISNDRGHLLDGVTRSKASPWGNFKGTWDEGMKCGRTKHCQTLTTLKSENASCLNNQTKKMHDIFKTDLTLSNKEQEKIFQDFSKVQPNTSQSPLMDPHENIQSPSGQHDVKIQSPLQLAGTKSKSPIQDIKTPSPVLNVASPRNENETVDAHALVD